MDSPSVVGGEEEGLPHGVDDVRGPRNGQPPSAVEEHERHAEAAREREDRIGQG